MYRSSLPPCLDSARSYFIRLDEATTMDQTSHCPPPSQLVAPRTSATDGPHRMSCPWRLRQAEQADSIRERCA